MDKMTVFYNKRLGIIKEVSDGTQSMAFYGNEEEDFSKIYDFLVVPYDRYIHENYHNMYVSNNELKIKNVDTPIQYL